MRTAIVPLFLFILGIVPNCVCGQLPDEEDFPPGILARYTAEGKTIERIDPAVAFDWGTSAPDPRLPEAPFSADWQGELLVRQAGTYTISAFVDGELEVLFDGQAVLKGSRPQAGWISGKPFALRFGDHPLRVRFRKTGNSAQVRLFWSSEHFPLEPLPSLLMFRESAHTGLNAIETGQTLFAAARCNRCHRRESDEPAPAAPALTHVREGIDPTWLLKKLSQPQSSPEAQMPDFGFTAEQAEQIAAFLFDASQKVKLAGVKTKNRKADSRQGQLLVRSVGCLACHTLEKEGQAGSFGGGELSSIGQKRSEVWLATWLKTPEKLNPDHRMPLVKLSDNECRQLAVFLAGLGDNTAGTSKPAKATPAMIKAGRQLVEASGCAACHRIPNIKPFAKPLADLSQPNENWADSCLSAKPDPKKHRPAYVQLEPLQRKAIQNYFHSRTGKLAKESEYERGKLVLEQKNCLMCHERNRAKGIVETAGKAARIDKDLQGQSEAMIPPALNAIGDKLLDAALTKAISGEQPKSRLPWLKVRMPRFQHSKEEMSAVLKYLIAHDRIPETAPLAKSAEKSETLINGNTLVGAKGFSCVACHRVGTFEPRNVALGTRGSDLLMLGKRMRKSFYLRWTRSPQRIVPGMEMPSLRKAVPGVLNENLEAQLIATWDALNDPEFTAPTSPSAVEQLLVVQPGEPVRIVRDVFTNPKENGGGYIARAMAVGLNNGHNLMLDLDNFTLRNWTFGDFARQRTEGKSWYWDLAGVPVMKGFTKNSDFALNAIGQPDSTPIHPIYQNNTCGRLLSYRNEKNGLQLEYELYFELNKNRHIVRGTERIEPTSAGWSRELKFKNLPPGFEMLINPNRRTPLVGDPKIEVEDSKNENQTDTVRVRDRVVRLRYITKLTRPQLASPPVPLSRAEAEAVTSVPGYRGERLPLSGSIMPTALAWTDRDLPGISKGTLAFTSLKGHVFLARDTNNDGGEDSLILFEEGLAAPYGIQPYHRGFLVAHKPEVIYLEDTDGDGRADLRRVVATGWGYSDNYHDWTTSLVRDSQGRFYVGLGSDYAQRNRSKETSRWRGAVLRLTPKPFSQDAAADFTPWTITLMGRAFRYPTGIAINDDDEIFVTDNQGVQNTFNELNHLVEGRHYGVPSRHETNPDAKPSLPAVQIPHPWSRSVNGLFFLPESGPGHTDFRGQAIGCEYDTRFLVRLSLQKVQGEYQGAAYYFSRPQAGAGSENFLGPLCGGVSPTGAIYIGNIHDSGWLGGQNTGDIVRLTPEKNFPTNGIREVRCTPEGFEVEFLKSIDPKSAANPQNYDVSGYTRNWKGSYATPDSGRHKLDVQSVSLQNDGSTASLHIKDRREGYVYEISCGRLSEFTKQPLFPDTAHYTLHKIPKSKSSND